MENNKIPKIIIGNSHVAGILSGMTRKRITCIIRCYDKDIDSTDKNTQDFPGFKYTNINRIDDMTLQKEYIREIFQNMKPVYNVMIYSDDDAKTHIRLCELYMVVFDMSLKDVLNMLSSYDDSFYYGASKYVFNDDDMNRLKKIELDIRGVSSIVPVELPLVKKPDTESKPKTKRQNKGIIRDDVVRKRKSDYDLIIKELNKYGKIINNDLLCDMLNSGIGNDDILYAFMNDI